LNGSDAVIPLSRLPFSPPAYTVRCIYAEALLIHLFLVSGEAEEPKLAVIVWEGDSRKVLRAFPEGVKQNLGFELWQLQQGARPKYYRPLPSIGTGVFEVRDQDERAWYRVV
jgi:phage-related protein